MKIAIVTDSNSGITQNQAKELGVSVIPMPFMINDKTYYEDITLTQEQFYEELKKELETLYPQAPIHMDSLSLSVACHIGPGAFAVACTKMLDI